MTPDQDITIAQFALTLQPPSVTPAGPAEAGQTGQLLRQANQRLMALEQWIHNELLRLMDLRRVDSVADTATVDARE